MRLLSRSLLPQPRPHPRTSRLAPLHLPAPSVSLPSLPSPPSSLPKPSHPCPRQRLSRSSAALATKREPKHRRCYWEKRTEAAAPLCCICAHKGEGGGRNESCFRSFYARLPQCLSEGFLLPVAMVPRFLPSTNFVYSGTAFCMVLTLQTAQSRLRSFAGKQREPFLFIWLLCMRSGSLVTSRGKLALTSFRALKA